MIHTKYVRRFVMAFVTSIAICQSPAFAYDLKTDWSEPANPNGPWSYRVGSVLLPYVANWTAGVSFPVPQPAYLPANTVGSFLPSWFRLAGTTTGFDAAVGDIIVHTNDGFNGNPSLGEANVLFAVPATGDYRVAGNLWNASTVLAPSDFRPRPQDWRILVNGVVKDSGTLDAIAGHFSRSSPDTFDLGTLSLLAGDLIELEIFKNPAAQAGYFVGTNMTINSVGGVSEVGEPISAALLVAGVTAVYASPSFRLPFTSSH